MNGTGDKPTQRRIGPSRPPGADGRRIFGVGCLVHRLSLSAASGCLALLLGFPAHAASDITVAAIALGRLYVVGTTDQPHTKVKLDGKFDTESDEKGLFQFHLVYHPAGCIVRAAIDGKTVEAVVGQCGEVCKPAQQANAPQVPVPSAPKPSPGSISAAPTPPTRPTGLAFAPDGPAATNALPPAAPAPPAASATGTARPILRPPLPPARPVGSASIAARPVDPAPAAEPPAPKPRPKPAPAQKEVLDPGSSLEAPDAPEGSDLY